MNLIKVVFDTKGRRDREGGKKRIKRLEAHLNVIEARLPPIGKHCLLLTMASQEQIML